MDTGLHEIELRADGRLRSYMLVVPEGYDARRPPALVILLHGTGGTAEGMLTLGRFGRHAHAEGFVVAAPNSLGLAFNDGSDRCGPEAMGVDDVTFIETVIADVSGRVELDPARIFIAGFSSGASMAQRVSLESECDIAAVFAPAGHLWVPHRMPARTRPILLMWGTEDPMNPMHGGKVVYQQSGVTLDKPPPLQTAVLWAERLGCTGEREVSIPLEGVQRATWNDGVGTAIVELYLVDALGHHWCGGRPVPLPEEAIGPYSDCIDATEVMWDFFKRCASSAFSP